MSILSNIQSQIVETVEDYEALKKVNSHLLEIERQLKLSYDKIKVLQIQMDKELDDINNLEKLGIKSLFYKTLGNKEEQLEKERQDYLEVSLRYKEHKAEVELMEFERDLLAKKNNNLPELKRKLADLKKLRKAEILASDEPLKNELQEILHKLDVNVALKKEILEALVQGEKAINVLDTIIDYLSKAGDWGKWDMYGDRNAKYNKRHAIDLAVRNLPQARHQLNLFMKELRDLGENDIEVKLDTIHFDKFTDFFFDNLISDWIVQQRIIGTANSMKSSKSYITRILMSLKHEESTVKKSIIQLESSKNEILLSM